MSVVPIAPLVIPLPGAIAGPATARFPRARKGGSAAQELPAEGNR